MTQNLQTLYGISQDPVVLQIVEKYDDESAVLAKVAGPSFVPGGYSRNKRYYPRELWEKQLQSESVKTRLAQRNMFGAIGHNQQIDEQAIADGAISHIVSKLEIRGDIGHGEFEILNTKAGRNLLTLLEAKCTLYVSSRGHGAYSNEKVNGMPTIDPTTFHLEGFDFVIDPGFLQAHPTLVESLHLLKPSEGEIGMGEINEELVRENAQIRAEFKEAASKLNEVEKTNEALTKENKELREAASKLEEATKSLEVYNKLGSPAEIERVFNHVEKFNRFFKENGQPSEIKTALITATKVIKEYKEIGSPEKIKESISKASKALNIYNKLGTPKQLDKCLTKLESLKKEQEAAKFEEQVRGLANKYNVSVEVVERLAKTSSGKELEETLKLVSGTTPSQKYKSHPKAPTNENKKAESKSRVTSLMKSFR